MRDSLMLFGHVDGESTPMESHITDNDKVCDTRPDTIGSTSIPVLSIVTNQQRCDNSKVVGNGNDFLVANEDHIDPAELWNDAKYVVPDAFNLMVDDSFPSQDELPPIDSFHIQYQEEILDAKCSKSNKANTVASVGTCDYWTHPDVYHPDKKKLAVRGSYGHIIISELKKMAATLKLDSKGRYFIKERLRCMSYFPPGPLYNSAKKVLMNRCRRYGYYDNEGRKFSPSCLAWIERIIGPNPKRGAFNISVLPIGTPQVVMLDNNNYTTAKDICLAVATHVFEKPKLGMSIKGALKKYKCNTLELLMIMTGMGNTDIERPHIT